MLSTYLVSGNFCAKFQENIFVKAAAITVEIPEIGAPYWTKIIIEFQTFSGHLEREKEGWKQIVIWSVFFRWEILIFGHFWSNGEIV